MFDVGFWELVTVGIVALLVFGPERLPKLAYEAGVWFTRLQRFARKTRFQIENELHNYEIRNSLSAETRLLEDVKSETRSAVRELEQSADISVGSTESAARDGQTNERT
ncbi:MAG TPA: Sec-independent protein translocase protein TatB [Gammaproteobacteria bacterium]